MNDSINLLPPSQFLHPDAVFGHVFQARGKGFYYDTNTNQILEIEPELAAVIPLYGTMSQDALVNIYKMHYSASKILEACAIIASARKEEGLFLARRPFLVPPNPLLSKPGECDSNLRHLILTVTDRCNLRCRYCIHGADLDWVRSHGEKSMTSEVALKSLQYFLDRTDPDKMPMVSFYGGEALLEFDLIAAVIAEGRKHPRGKDAMFIIDTNGVLIDERVIDLVIQENVYLQISIDGPLVWHDRNRIDIHGNGTLEKILGNIDTLLSRDPTAFKRLSFIATMAPPTDLFELAEFFAAFPPFVKHGIKSQPAVRVNSANLEGMDWPAEKADFRALAGQVEEARRQYLDAVADGSRETISPVIKALFEPEIFKLHHRWKGTLGSKFTPGGNCKPGKRKLHVTVDGRFQPCERTGRMMEVGSLVGGIDSEMVSGLEERFFEAVKGKCEGCWAVRFCGVCFAVQAGCSVDGAGQERMEERACERVRKDRGMTLGMLGWILGLGEERKSFLGEVVVE